MMYLQYQRLAQRVREIVEDVAEENLIRCSVQHRVKSVDRLQKKLLAWRDKGKLEGRTTDAAILGRVGDISAVRVTTYLDRDRLRMSDKLRERLACAEVDVKDRPDSLYRAIHLQVGLQDEDMEAPEDQALKGLSCEIQVCTLLSHVYSEIEHDLRYKPLSGELSVDEQRLLDALGHLTLTGDQIILSLIERSELRVRERSVETPDGSAQVDALDLMTILGPKLDFLDRYRDNAASVLRFLDSIGMKNAGEIEKTLLEEGAAVRWGRMKRAVHGHIAETGKLIGTKTVPYDADTADGLLLLAAEKMPGAIRHMLAARKPGRPSREVTIAGQILDALPGLPLAN